MTPGADELPEHVRSIPAAIARTLSHYHEVCNHLSAVVMEDLRLRQEGSLYRLSQLERAYDAVQDLLQREPRSLLGMGFAADPAAFQEPAILWWYAAEEGQEPRSLNARLQPGNLAFYDYTGSQWWKRAGIDGAPRITGPYIDHGGTNAHIVTVSRAVLLDGGKVGVTAADILVGTLQSVWQPVLDEIGKPSSIIDEDGVVVVTNSGRLMGARIQPGSDSHSLPIPGTGWQLVIGG